MEAAFEIKDAVYEKFGFTVNIGISVNHLLAKMASDFEKPNKVHTLFPKEIPVKMWPLPISELYMAGRSSVEVLNKLEIRTIGELAKADPNLLELHLKSHGRTLWEFANGIDHEKFEEDTWRIRGSVIRRHWQKMLSQRKKRKKFFCGWQKVLAGDFARKNREPVW